ncbi:carbohydrate-binding module family 13 protein [Suillus subluteus]|nr:carbohydrate-binding module family 13 protein [Suillus subluteus]
MSCIQNQHIYTLKNRQGGTVIDLSGGDNQSIIGYNDHNGPNQSWIFQRADDAWFIKSAGTDKYLGVEGDVNNAGDGTRVVAVPSPFKWDIKDSDMEGVGGIRILLHDKQFSVDLSDKGNATEGTPVQLWTGWQGANQIWAPVERT